jgi:NAD(P)-dependent dehydrogenase (short-subunit alcohol dehydrogenase family)
MDGFERPGDTENARWEKVMGVNLNGPFYTTRACIPYFEKNETKAEEGAMSVYDALGNAHPPPPPSKGVIVNICSIASLGGGGAGAAYTTSKHALLGLSRSTAWMYRNDGIRCNAVFPGGTSTNIYANSQVKIDEKGMAAVQPWHNLMPGMSMAPGSIASAVLWLAMPANMNVNGAEIVVDGGWTSV